MRLLDDHPQLSVLPDETYFYAQILLRRPWSYAFRLAEFSLSTRLASWITVVVLSPKCNHIPQLFNEKIGLLRTRMPTPKYWVEKTPSNERFIPIIELHYNKSARYLHIVRDPRDVVASWLLHDEPDTGNRRAVIRSICHTWALSTYLASRYRASIADRYHIIQYETLVRESETIMNQIASWMKIQSAPGLLRPSRLGVSQPINSSFQMDVAAGTISDKTIGRYADLLSHDEIVEIESFLGPQMRQFGYRSKFEKPPGFRRQWLWPIDIAKLCHIRAMQRHIR